MEKKTLTPHIMLVPLSGTDEAEPMLGRLSGLHMLKIGSIEGTRDKIDSLTFDFPGDLEWKIFDGFKECVVANGESCLVYAIHHHQRDENWPGWVLSGSCVWIRHRQEERDTANHIFAFASRPSLFYPTTALVNMGHELAAFDCATGEPRDQQTSYFLKGFLRPIPDFETLVMGMTRVAIDDGGIT